ncbi:MAG: hypothetical protein Q7R33_02130, partial [Nitrosarchaeum sp.]|nr:hypothetical protein [Nitrosarchaeum sp.]
MKKTIFLIIFAFINNFLLLSQTCLPEGILFTSQNEIDNFQINYPNCTEIEGSVSISGNNINNLNGLSVLTNIGGDLKISSNDSITSFYGLNNLNSVTGDLKLTLLSGIHDMIGLDNLTFVGGKLEIGTFSVSSLTGLENLDSIGGNLDIYYTPVKNLNGLNNLIS